MKQFFLYFLGLVFLLIQHSCHTDELLLVQPSKDVKPGLGDSQAMPTGTPLVLPKQVKVVGDCPGFGAVEDHKKAVKGSGDLVRLILTLQNTSAHPIDIHLPAGLIFVSKSLETQNGVLLNPIVISLDANQTVSTTINLYCINMGRNPSKTEDWFTIGPITDDKDLLELIHLLRYKPLPLHGEPIIQQAVWHITDDKGLTVQDRHALNTLL